MSYTRIIIKTTIIIDIQYIYIHYLHFILLCDGYNVTGEDPYLLYSQLGA